MKKNIDLNSIENLTKLKESLENVIEKRITEAKNNNAISSVDKMPFYCLNSLFESVSDKLYETKNGKSLIKKYVKVIKENSDLKNYYRICEAITSPKNVGDSYVFLSEAISLGKSINAENYKKSLKNVSNIIKECINEAHITTDEIEAVGNSYKGSVNESIDYLVFNDKSFGNVAEYSNNMSNIVSYINENKKSESVINESEKSVKEILNDFDSLFTDDMELWEAKVVKDMALASIKGISKKELFENYKNDCVSMIDESMKNSDIEKSARLNEMKSKLSLKQFNEETVTEDILRLSELKEALNN